MPNGNEYNPCYRLKNRLVSSEKWTYGMCDRAIFYRADNGIKWRALPSDFPAWQTVYGYFRLWVKLGVWEQINAELVRQVRTHAGRAEQPSLVIIDSQSVRLGQKGEPARCGGSPRCSDWRGKNKELTNLRR